MIFFSFLQDKIGCVSDDLHTQARPIGIRRAICPDLIYVFSAYSFGKQVFGLPVYFELSVLF